MCLEGDGTMGVFLLSVGSSTDVFMIDLLLDVAQKSELPLQFLSPGFLATAREKSSSVAGYHRAISA